MSSIRDTWNQHKTSTIYLGTALVASLVALLFGLTTLSLVITTTAFICAVAIVLVERAANRTLDDKPEPTFLMPGEDAFQLANFFLHGDGTEAMNLIYGSDYAAPVRLALLLEQTAAVLRIKQ